MNAKRCKILVALLMLPVFSALMMANGIVTVSQVSGTVSITTNVDYVVTSTDPFADGAILDIVNIENAVAIFPNVKPSVLLENHLSHIRINGARAAKNNNCMVKIYANGSMVLPHGNNIKPLTVYTEKEQTGESAQFGVSSRVSLDGNAFNNKIKSFTLKRGYMVWFATKSSNYDPGYNRIFIADKTDIEVDLPAILCSSISALRVSQWNDASKKGYAGWDPAFNEPLNTTWCYNWDAGVNIWDDREYVTIRQHKNGWPSYTDVANNGTSANALHFNEPDNLNDAAQTPATVAEALAQWPEMMATGRRLGSPAMASNWSWLYEFMDSIDARGWRCDFVAVHAYWYSDWPSWNSTLSGVHNRTGRPIWITEMNYGANWTGWPGSNTEGNAANYAIQYQHMKPILDGLEATPWLERYAYYNWVQDCRKVIDGSMKLTPIGEYYAAIQSDIAYSSTYNVVPKLPKMKSPDNFKVHYESKTTTATLTWREYNGEYNESINVQRRMDGNSTWQTVASVELKEGVYDYTYQDTNALNGYQYRVLVVDAAGKEHSTPMRQAVLEKVDAGDAVQVNGVLKYVGGNLFPDGDFELGAIGWMDGANSPISESPYFSVFPVGGVDGGTYLHARNQKDSYLLNAEGLKGVVDLEKNRDYYFSMALIGSSAFHRLQLTGHQTKKDSTVATLKFSDIWAYQEFSFNSSDYPQAMFTAVAMGGKSQFDKVVLCPLFDTKDEAVAHGVTIARRQVGYVSAYLEGFPELQLELDNELAAVTTTDEEALWNLTNAIEKAMSGARAKHSIDSLLAYTETAVALKLDGYQRLREVIARAKEANRAIEYIEAFTDLHKALADYLPYIYAVDAVAAPDFNRTSVGWAVKCGTYTGGDQRMNLSMAGKSCWNAWWSGINADEGKNKTMEIRQVVKNLDHGIYSIECKAGTQNNCLSDQHAYMVVGNDTLVSENLSYDRLDLPTVPDTAKWEVLATPPVYIGDKGALTIGFVGSKMGAVDNAWKKIGDMSSVGDKREGWWCATDFALRFIPLYRTQTPEGEWGVICLPRQIKPTDSVELYHLEGILSDYSALCLQKVVETEAGVPYIYHTKERDVCFYEEGQTVDMPSLTDPVWGDFYGNWELPAGCYYMENGQWHRATNEKTHFLQPYTGYINSALDLPVLESWLGVTIPINGAAEEKVQSILPVFVDGRPTSVPDGIYTVDGRSVDSPVQGEVYIRVQKGKAVKVIQKE